MQNAVLEKLAKEQMSQVKKLPSFHVGDRINVHARLKEGDKERVQSFRGVVICKKPKSGLGAGAMFTVRKVSEGVGVEKIFPLHSPVIEKIEVESSAKVRRSRLYYLRGLKGRKARLKTSERFGELVTPEAQAGAALTASQPAAGMVAASATEPSKEAKPKEAKSQEAKPQESKIESKKK